MAEKRGRPTIVTPEKIDKLEYAFSLGCSDLEACFHADISKSCLYEYQKRHPEFVERKERLKANPVLKARISAIQGLEEDHNHALRFLERVKKDEFSTRHETTGKDGDAIETKDISDNDLARKLALVLASGMVKSTDGG